MRSRQEWLDHPVGAYAKDTPIIEFEKRGNSHSRKLGQSKSRLLSGVRVLDLTNVIANPIGGRLLAEARLDRSRHFPAKLFAEPAWDMLLCLCAAELDQQRVSVTSLSIASNVPTTTALRWISTLESEGLVERRSDPLDARRFFLSPTALAMSAMEDYFRDLSSGIIPI